MNNLDVIRQKIYYTTEPYVPRLIEKKIKPVYITLNPPLGVKTYEPFCLDYKLIRTSNFHYYYHEKVSAVDIDTVLNDLFELCFADDCCLVMSDWRNFESQKEIIKEFFDYKIKLYTGQARTFL